MDSKSTTKPFLADNAETSCAGIGRLRKEPAIQAGALMDVYVM